MSETVLFSPIGMTDPIRGNYDGPFLHILRHYKPQKTYLFLTAEVCEYDTADDRYALLANRVCPACQIVKQPRPNFTNPHDYKTADEQIRAALGDVIAQNPNARILVNVTSSTSQITAALYVYAASSLVRNITLIQVETPQKKSNLSQPVPKNFDIEAEWQNNFDNLTDDPDIKNRCTEITPQNVRHTVLCDTIASHIDNFDYKAASDAASAAQALFGAPLHALLQMGCLRLSLLFDQIRAKKLEETAGYRLLTIENSTAAREIFEYILYLNIRLQQDQAAEFARAVSPLLTRLFVEYLKNVHKIDIEKNYCYQNAKGVLIIEPPKMSPEMLAVYQREFNNRFAAAPLAYSGILPMLRYACEKDGEKFKGHVEKAARLRDFEEQVRNISAHEIVGLSKEILKKKYSFNPEALMRNVHFFFEQTYPNHKNLLQTNPYDDLNDQIKKHLV